MRKSFFPLLVLTAILFAAFPAIQAQEANFPHKMPVETNQVPDAVSYDAMAENFAHPASVRTGAYWYWLSGNFSKEGVVKDLEAMKRAGIDRAPSAIIPAEILTVFMKPPTERSGIWKIR